ncbi:hypothetical protein AcW1_004863 [Taiwanofungus camphoratus]|nr:hypothetical protein AcW2_006128 [Antrodia cinnamomea]KAI0940037.1 hypothetical protein AcV5_001252 [Antrodia cinnamomea]KAI0960320.1 hypothetical protein AcW1_004863 [Antrodia cinnamomea]
MPGLIQRCNEHSKLLSSAPAHSHSQSHQVQSPQSRRWPSAAQAAITTEASSWYEAVFPPFEDVQAAIRRFRNDPDFSQERVFSFISPLFAFALFFVVCLIAGQPKSFAHHVLKAPRAHTKELAVYSLSFFGMLLAGLAILRTLIWCVAEVSSMIVAVDRGRANSAPLPSSNVLLGGIFM